MSEKIPQVWIEISDTDVERAIQLAENRQYKSLNNMLQRCAISELPTRLVKEYVLPGNDKDTLSDTKRWVLRIIFKLKLESAMIQLAEELNNIPKKDREWIATEIVKNGEMLAAYKTMMQYDILPEGVVESSLAPTLMERHPVLAGRMIAEFLQFKKAEIATGRWIDSVTPF